MMYLQKVGGKYIPFLQDDVDSNPSRPIMASVTLKMPARPLLRTCSEDTTCLAIETFLYPLASQMKSTYCFRYEAAAAESRMAARLSWRAVCLRRPQEVQKRAADTLAYLNLQSGAKFHAYHDQAKICTTEWYDVAYNHRARLRKYHALAAHN